MDMSDTNEDKQRPEYTAPERPYEEAFRGTPEELEAKRNGVPVPAPVETDRPADSIDELTTDDIKDRLRGAGLKVGGSRDELIARLREHNQPGNAAV
jgi:hypothetical protein